MRFSECAKIKTREILFFYVRKNQSMQFKKSRNKTSYNLKNPSQSVRIAMSSVGIVVEWLFGDITNSFAFMDLKENLKVGLSAVGKMYIVFSQCFHSTFSLLLGIRSFNFDLAFLGTTILFIN